MQGVPQRPPDLSVPAVPQPLPSNLLPVLPCVRHARPRPLQQGGLGHRHLLAQLVVRGILLRGADQREKFGTGLQHRKVRDNGELHVTP